MNSEWLRPLLAGLLVVAGGGGLHRLAQAAAPRAEAAGWGALGAWRGAAANGLWLQATLAQEEGDAARTRALVRATVAAAPESEYFRRNAARILAYDLPAWRVAREPGAPAAVQRAWRLAAADEALAVLVPEAAGAPAARLLEAARLHLIVRADRAAAAEWFRRAAEQPDAPWHAGRIYVRLLRELGREREALAWLRAWWPRLPADDPAAQRDLVGAWLVELAAKEP